MNPRRILLAAFALVCASVVDARGQSLCNINGNVCPMQGSWADGQPCYCDSASGRWYGNVVNPAGPAPGAPLGTRSGPGGAQQETPLPRMPPMGPPLGRVTRDPF